MILGKKIRSFTAEDSGIVAQGLRAPAVAVSESAPVLAKAAAVESVAVAPVSVATPAVEPNRLSEQERGRLWALVGLLRKANARLWKANRRLTKETAALREELDSGERVTVDSILSSQPVRQ